MGLGLAASLPHFEAIQRILKKGPEKIPNVFRVSASVFVTLLEWAIPHLEVPATSDQDVSCVYAAPISLTVNIGQQSIRAGSRGRSAGSLDIPNTLQERFVGKHVV